MLSGEVTNGTANKLPKSRRFAVAWRNTTRRRVSTVAVMDFDGATYRFQYLQTASRLQDFRPFVGFPDVERIYEAERLWPFFALRVMDRRRPDFSRYVEWLGLEPDATALDILSRSGGERQGDPVHVVEEPHVDDAGNTEAVFFVRGTRYATKEYESASTVGSLGQGDQLSLKADEQNPANASALHVTAAGEPVGWIPDLLLPYVWMIKERRFRLSVVRNNGPEAPWHLRLLVRLVGRANPGYEAFTGPGWPSRLPGSETF